MTVLRSADWIRAVEDPELLDEFREREIVLDVCPVSNVPARCPRSTSTR
jgi:adenosine deaminase